MRLLTIMVFLIARLQSFGQSFSYPVFKDSGRTIKSFIPPNWFLDDSTAGDLNGDSISDLALVLEYKDTINETRPDGTISKCSPRILLILFKNKSSGFYDPVLQNNTIIPRGEEGGMDPNAFGKLSISKRILNVEFYFIHGNSNYKFRFQNDNFYLIGAISNGVAGGEYYSTDVNFLTRKAKEISSDLVGEHEKTKWQTILSIRLVKLKDFKMLFTLEVMPGIFM